MEQSGEPRVTFEVQVSRETYLAAARVASRQSGQLRLLRLSAPAAMLILLLIVFTFRDNPTAAVLLAIAGALLFVAAAVCMRRAVSSEAARNFEVFDALYNPATVTLREDTMEFSGKQFARSDPYARLERMVETPVLLVFLREEGSFTVLPRADIPADGSADSGGTIEFLRTVFARKYRRMR